MQHRQDDEKRPFEGRDVVDEWGTRVGSVVEVIYDGPDPVWLVVDPGWLRAPHYVPIEGIYAGAAGHLVVPYEKGWVRSAPKATGADELSADTLRELVDHYELADNYG
ncbi:MAG: PRC-barrel domain-containing protein [Acidimicrobiales bacterium]